MVHPYHKLGHLRLMKSRCLLCCHPTKMFSLHLSVCLSTCFCLFLPLPVSLYICVHICACVFICVQVSLPHIPMQLRRKSQSCSSGTIYASLETGLSLAWNLSHKQGCLASEPQGFTCLSLLSTGVVNILHHASHIQCRF